MSFYPPENTKIAVAMSGGVDSSVTAYLLLRKGYRVEGVTMRVMPEELMSSSAVESAQNAARQLRIPHHVIDVSDQFHENIIKPFCAQYMKGRTPNPCILCNKLIKFSVLIEFALKAGAEYLATGHYARIVHDEYVRLKKGIDTKKDQSYFLAKLDQNQLSRIVMPLGEYTKQQVRLIAQEASLCAKNREESQEICFLPDGDYANFVHRHAQVQAKPGPIMDIFGRTIGTHRGLPYYTIGQRKFLGVSLGRPQYVIEIKTAQNAIVIGDNRHLLRRGVRVIDPNWTTPQKPESGIKLKARIRYRHTEEPGILVTTDDKETQFLFNQAQRAITPGQQIVFYSGDEVIGSGVIDSSFD